MDPSSSNSATPANPATQPNSTPPLIGWEAVRQDEQNAIDCSLGAHGGALTGLAFSGGGIRSATFCLGIIQGMAAKRKLSTFDYLSTVSGGGYVGSWLSALICRRAAGDVAKFEAMISPQEKLKSLVAPIVDSSVEHPCLQWLRKYSNYLTPRVGVFGIDTWTAIATYLRNLTLNWLVLVPLLITLIAVALLELPMAQWLHQQGWRALLIAAFVSLVCVACAIGFSIDKPPANSTPRDLDIRQRVVAGVGLGTVLTAWVAAIALGAAPQTFGFANTQFGKLAFGCLTDTGLGATSATNAMRVAGWAAIAGGANLVVWALMAAVRHFTDEPEARSATAAKDYDSGLKMTEKWWQWLLPLLASGALAGVLLMLWTRARHRWMEGLDADSLAPAAFDSIIGMPVVLVIMSHAILLFIGLAKRRMGEADREWLGRLGAILFLLGMAWLAAYAMIWLGAVAASLQHALGTWFAGVGVSAWLLQTLAAVILGKSSVTGAGKDTSTGKKWLELMLSVAPYLFVAGLVAATSYVLFNVLHMSFAAQAPSVRLDSLQGNTLDALDSVGQTGGLKLALVVFGFAVLTALMSWRVDINLFSYNRFYGNRLARAYLGASRHRDARKIERRNANPFTDLDTDDDLCMAMLATHKPDGTPMSVQRPLHIINTALNITGAPDLAWQSRKAASFTFSPLHCGYAFPAAKAMAGVEPLDAIEGYRRSYEYGVSSDGSQPLEAMGQINRGVTFAMAFPTSGAAASPNMGYHSTPAMALLLTTFNVRLGRWFGNPRDEQAWQRRTPTFSLRALVNELLGDTGFTQPWLYLSDGGHFENLGIYELVRRRLKLIVAVDAAEDPEYTFGDLANATRLVSADFGVRIEMPDIESMRPDATSKVATNAFTFGKIHYPDGSVGVLIYVKPVLLADSPVDVVEYARRGTGFPQESTGDQWFSEAQFESYRRLGETIAHRLCEKDWGTFGAASTPATPATPAPTAPPAP